MYCIEQPVFITLPVRSLSLSRVRWRCANSVGAQPAFIASVVAQCQLSHLAREAAQLVLVLSAVPTQRHPTAAQAADTHQHSTG